MRLITAHKILISTAVALSLLMSVRAAVLFASGGAASDLIFAVVGLALAVALALYLRTLWRR
jgi:hypothetical protein